MMTDRAKFKGLGVALITPMSENGSIDFAALAAIIDTTIEGGADFLVVLGTTSESPTLLSDEKKAIAHFVRNRVAGKVPLVLGVGGNCTKEVVEQLKNGIAKGYDAILSVCPYYNKPNQEGLYRHFKAISEASEWPIILYNIPGRSGVNMLPTTVARLAAECKNIIGIKEASGNVEQAAEVVRVTPDDFLVLSGDDALVVETMRRGGDGIISVVAQLYPRQSAHLVHLAEQGEFDKAQQRLSQMREIIDCLFEEGNPVGVKGALSVKSLCRNIVRLPLAEASDKLLEKVKRAMAEYENGEKVR